MRPPLKHNTSLNNVVQLIICNLNTTFRISHQDGESRECVHHFNNRWCDYKLRQTHTINHSTKLLHKSPDITSLQDSEERTVFVQIVNATDYRTQVGTEWILWKNKMSNTDKSQSIWLVNIMLYSTHAALCCGCVLLRLFNGALPRVHFKIHQRINYGIIRLLMKVWKCEELTLKVVGKPILEIFTRIKEGDNRI